MQSCDEPFVPSLFDDSLDEAVNRFNERYRNFEAVREFLEEMRDWHECLLIALRRFQGHPDFDPAEYPFEGYLYGIEYSYQELEDAILEANDPVPLEGYVAGIEDSYKAIVDEILEASPSTASAVEASS